MKYPTGKLLLFVAAAFTALLLACGDDDSDQPGASETHTADASASPAGSPTEPAELPEECNVSEDEIGMASRLEFEQDGEYRHGGQFPVGEPVTARMRLINCTRDSIRLYFSTTQRYEMLIESDETGDRIWSSTDGESFADTPGEDVLEPAGTIAYTEIWDQMDSEGVQAPPGVYKVSFLSVACTVQSADECRFGPVSRIEITD